MIRPRMTRAAFRGHPAGEHTMTATLTKTPYTRSSHKAREAPSTYSTQLNEATLASLWAGQRFPRAALSLPDGQKLRVIHPGRRGNPGPDFKDAVIIADEQSWYGDVEIHLSAADWRAHGHARDPAYERVILHIVFQEPDPDQPLARTASGRIVPTIALERWLSWRTGELVSWLEGPDRWRSPCADASERLGKAECGTLLETLSLARLRERMPSASSSPEEHLYLFLMESAGAPHERIVYRSIAARLPWGQLRGSLLLLATADRAEAAQTALMDAFQTQDMHPHQYQSVRPGARPERRLAGMARLLSRYTASGLLDPLSRAALRSVPDLLNVLSVGPAGHGQSALIGRGKAIELATNAVLPVLLGQALHSGNSEAERILIDRYLSLPRPARYGKTAELEAAIAGASLLPLAGAAGQQALLHLQKNFCSAGMCGRCPLSVNISPGMTPETELRPS